MRSVKPSFPRRCCSRGFTLTELLVVIAMIAILVAILFPLLRLAKGKMQTAEAVSRIRECGNITLQKAAENNNFLQIHAVGTSRNMHDLRLHGMVKEVVGQHDVGRYVYTPAYEEQAKGTWPVWGVNLDGNAEFEVEWERVWIERGGQQRYLEGLRLAKCGAMERYPLLADSSNSSGVPRARFANDNQHKFAMRYQGKGPIFFLDGATRMVGKGEMGKYGITDAYLFEDDPVSNPTLVSTVQGSN